MIFDCLDQELEQERIIYINGIDLGKVLSRCRDRVLEKAANLCGFIHDKDNE